MTLRGLGNGEHVMSIAVDPEHFGPVRVIAHITPDAVRIELLGGTDQSREALRTSLADLRRDLAGSGLHAELSLGRDAQTGNDGWRGSAGTQGDGLGAGAGRRSPRGDADSAGPARRPAAVPDPTRSATRPGVLDLLV
jgi:flagellar hook-length control protein FliK